MTSCKIKQTAACQWTKPFHQIPCNLSACIWHKNGFISKSHCALHIQGYTQFIKRNYLREHNVRYRSHTKFVHCKLKGVSHGLNIRTQRVTKSGGVDLCSFHHYFAIPTTIALASSYQSPSLHAKSYLLNLPTP